jgi:hypothetical protein
MGIPEDAQLASESWGLITRADPRGQEYTGVYRNIQATEEHVGWLHEAGRVQRSDQNQEIHAPLGSDWRSREQRSLYGILSSDL